MFVLRTFPAFIYYRMIVKTFEIKKINLDKTRLFLFYGENEGYKNEIIKTRFENNYLNQIYRYDEKEIIDKKNDFFYSILSKSFFDNKKLIIISRVTDKIRDIIEEIITSLFWLHHSNCHQILQCRVYPRMVNASGLIYATC